MTYQTQPGTIAHRAVEHLRRQPAGAELPTALLCEAIEVDSGNFKTLMGPALRHGAVRARRADTGRSLVWSLGDGTPLDVEQDEPLRPAAPSVFQLAGPVPEVVPEAAFDAKLHLDGDLDLYGLVELEDGGYRITRDNLARLKQLITWASPA